MNNKETTNVLFYNIENPVFIEKILLHYMLLCYKQWEDTSFHSFWDSFKESVLIYNLFVSYYGWLEKKPFQTIMFSFLLAK